MSIEWPLIITPTFLCSIPNFGVLVPKQLTVSPKIGGKVVAIMFVRPHALLAQFFVSYASLQSQGHFDFS